MSDAHIWPHIARVVDRERQARGLSVRSLAQQAEVDESTVRRLLGGEPVRLGSLRAVATSLGLGWTALVGTLAEREAPGLQLSGSHR